MKKKLKGEANEKRILKILNELYSQTNNNYISLNVKEIESKYNIGSNIRAQIFGNLIESKLDASSKPDITKPGKHYVYKWKTIKPNIYMAKKVCEDARNESRKYYKSVVLSNSNKKEKNISLNKKQNINTKNKVEELKIKNKSINILWGLIKINF